MMFNHTPKLIDATRERLLFLNRIKFVKVAIVLVFCVLAGRVLYLQVIAHEKFASRSENNRIHLQAVAPSRGHIKDYHGRILATNKRVQSVFFSPAIAKEAHADTAQVIAQIGEILRFQPVSQQELVERVMTNTRKSQNILIKSDISEAELARLMVRQHQLSGLVIKSSSNRYYPYSEVLGHAVGYLGLITRKDLQDPRFNNPNYQGTQQIGRSGAERHYESLLHGKVGWQKVEVDARGVVHRVLDRKQPSHGSELRLGLDAELQKTAWSLIAGKRGSVVAIEPDTGRLMVLLSSPAFNPNLMVSGVDAATYKKLTSSRAQPFFNRFAQGRYPPASTIKPMYALSALQSKVIDPKERIYDQGYYQIEGDPRRYRNWFRSGHGFVDMSRAIRVSNDTYFFGLAERMGYNLLSTSLKEFGFGRAGAIDVYGEATSYIPSPEWKYVRFNQSWFAGDNLNMGIGQGYVLVTPLQLAAATSVVANRGRWVRPRLLFGIDNKWVKDWQNVEPFVDVSADAEHWQLVIDAMVSVTNNPEGTAYRAAKATPFMIAGKTGTAQVVNLLTDDSNKQALAEGEYTRDHALFIGFAPVTNPKIAIAVILENGGSGGSDAAPIAVKIIDTYLRSKRYQLSQLKEANE